MLYRRFFALIKCARATLQISDRSQTPYKTVWAIYKLDRMQSYTAI